MIIQGFLKKAGFDEDGKNLPWDGCFRPLPLKVYCRHLQNGRKSAGNGVLLGLLFAAMIEVGAPFTPPNPAMHPWRYAFRRVFRILPSAMPASSAIHEPMSKETGSADPRCWVSTA